jgi:PAS domain S-box-containing protein
MAASPAGVAADRWATAGGLALVAALAALDSSWGEDRIISATPVIAPFFTALFARPRHTAVVAVAAVVACALSFVWHDNFGDVAWAFRLAVVVVGGAFAILVSRARTRLAVDRERFVLLSKVAEAADGPPAPEETTARLSDLLVPGLADIAMIDVRRDDHVERLAVAAHGPRAAEIEAGMAARDPAARVAALPGADRLQLIERIGDDLVRALGRTDEEVVFLRGLGLRSAIVVPLRTRGRTIGSLVLITTRASGRDYDADTAEFARVLGGRVGLALDNAGLVSELESLEAQTTAALGNLAEAVTVQGRDGRLIYANDAAARALGFPTARALLDTPPQQIVDAYESFLDDGRPLRLEDLPGRKVLAGQEAQPVLVRAVHRQTGEERWRVVKATAVTGPDGRPHLAVNVIEDVTEVKRAETAQRFLAEAGEALASSLDAGETLTRVAQLAVPRLADWCAVAMPDETGRLSQVAVAHPDPERVRLARELQERWPAHVSDESGTGQVVREGVPQIVNEITDELLAATIDDPEQLAAVRRLGMRAAMIVPMVAAGGTVGAITFISAESGRTFTPADLELAEDLGRRAGTAVENARLYTERAQIARTLQVGLLPDALPAVPGLGLASLYRPAGEDVLVGGDFYDAFRTASGWMIIVGDVTGRGTEAAALTGQARHTLRTAGTLLGDPAAAVDQLNRELTQRHDLPICTVAAVLLEDAGDRTAARVVCAGHPPPVHVRAGRARQVGKSGPVVGAWRDAEWHTTTVALEPGDLLVVHTDGVLDAHGATGRFGEERLVETLRDATGADDAVARIRRALDDFERGEQADDTAVLAVERLALAPARQEVPTGPGGESFPVK